MSAMPIFRLMATMFMVVAVMIAHTRGSVMAVFWYMRKQGMRFVDGDDTLVYRQDDADIKFWHLFC